MTDSDPILYFVHIPKTAGTSLREVIAEQYRPQEVVRVYDKEATNFAAVRAAGTVGDAGTSVVMGHFAFGMHRLNPRPFVYTSMIRHPVERAVSHYLHNRRDPRSPFHALAQGPLDRYVAEVDFIQDRQAMKLGARRRVKGEGKLEVSSPLARRALATIDAHFVTCGVSERFEESCRLLAFAMGWKLERLPKLNVAPTAHPEVDAATRRAIEKVNEADLELYDHVNARLDQDLERMRELGELEAGALPTVGAGRWKLGRLARGLLKR